MHFSIPIKASDKCYLGLELNVNVRYYCYPCDYNLCLGCVERVVKEKSQQVQLVSCLQELCDKVRDSVESKQREEQEEDDIPLIDDDHSGYHSPVPLRGSSIIPTNFALPVKVTSLMII